MNAEYRYAKSSANRHDHLSLPLPNPGIDVAPDAYQNSLAERVQRLEQLLHTQNAATTARPSPRKRSVSPPTTRGHPESPAVDLRGSLQKTSTGHVRFIPQYLDWQSRTDAVFGSMTNSLPLNHGTRTSREDFWNTLPPKSSCTELVRIYFSSFASLFHILHEPTFHDTYDRLLEDPDTASLAWLALLFALLSTAVLALPAESHLLHDLNRSPTTLGKRTDLSSRFQSRAMQCLDADQYLWNHIVQTLQTLILVVYGTGHNYGQGWTLLGVAHHIALSIGCHVDPSTFDPDEVKCEERRRCWAGLKMLYNNHNTVTGHVGPYIIFLAVQLSSAR